MDEKYEIDTYKPRSLPSDWDNTDHIISDEEVSRVLADIAARDARISELETLAESYHNVIEQIEFARNEKESDAAWQKARLLEISHYLLIK